MESPVNPNMPPEPDKAARIYFWVGLFVALGALGLPLIGVTVNVWLGGAILAIAFFCIVRAFWIWEKPWRFHILLRLGTTVVAAALYFGLAGRQIISQYRLDHPKPETTKQNESKPLEPKGEESKKESPKVEHPPAIKKQSPAKPVKESEPLAFAVAVETKMLVPSPSKDEAGTGFWGVSTFGPNCFLRSADVVMLIRIKNLQPIKTMITAYNVYGMGGELNRIKMNMYRPVAILKKGVIPPNFQGKFSYPVPAPSGNVGGGFYMFKFAEMDFSVAVPIQDDILDNEIADHYLEPGDTVRGWTFFEYPSAGSMPVMLTVKISDDLGHTSSYRIPDEPGNPTGDALRRTISFIGPAVNLSSCIRQPHPAPLQ